MKTVTKLIYVSFNEHGESGVAHYIYDDNMREYMDNNEPGFKFLCEVVLPEVDKKAIMAMGVAQIDKELAELHMQMEHKKAKKQQLLAIEHNEGNNNE